MCEMLVIDLFYGKHNIELQSFAATIL